MADYARVDLDAENQVTFELNGEKVAAPAGTMLVDACYAHGVEVPIFCYEPRIGPPVGACRMCLVEIEGMRGLQTACSTPVQADMVVRTNSPAAKDGQESVLELLLANHPLDCPVCDKGGECPLQDRTFRFGPGASRFVDPKRHFPKPLELSSRIALDRERCISCFRCVRFSQEVAQDGQLTMQERGARSEITTFSGDAYEARFTGNIIDICPVGALTSIPYRFVARPWDVTNTPSVCALCPVGCNTELTLREGDVKRVTGRDEPNFAVEEGWLCDVGRWGYDGDAAVTRLTRAVVRDATGERHTDLGDAVAAAALALTGLDRPVGILVGPDATVEEAAIALELAGAALPGARVGRLGIPAGPLAPLRATPRAELDEIDRADLVLIVGGNPGSQQPVTELRVRKAALRAGARVVTVGPRPGSLADIATHVTAAPGALAPAIAGLADQITATGRPIVLWDEADLAAEPAAATALAEAVVANGATRQIELGADVNGAGLRALGLRATGLREALAAGELGALLTVRADPLAAAGRTAWQAALAADIPVVALATHADATTDRATVVLPVQSLWEQEGTLVSMTGRAQRVRRGADGPEGAAAGWEVLIALGHHLGAPPAYRTPSRALEAAAAAHPALAGLSYDAMGTLGVTLPRPGPADLADDVTAAAATGDGVVLVATGDVYGGAAAARSQALVAFHTPAAATMSAATAAAYGVAEPQPVTLTSPYGSAELPVRIAADAPDDTVFVTLGTAAADAEALLAAGRGPVRVQISVGVRS